MKRNHLTVRVSEAFGERKKEISRIVRDTMRERMREYDDGVLVEVNPSDDWDEGYWDNEARGQRVIGTGIAYRNGWISCRESMPPSATYAMFLYIPVGGPDHAWPYWEYGSPRRYSETRPPERVPRPWPLMRYDSWQEELVALIGHEAKHVLDYSRLNAGEPIPKRREVQAERAAYRALEAFRAKRARRRPKGAATA